MITTRLIINPSIKDIVGPQEYLIQDKKPPASGIEVA